MAPNFRRILRPTPAWLLLAAAWLPLSAAAEERKFVVLLADPSKDHRGSSLNLPNRNDVYDAYFDKSKNGQNGQPRVDSHAEWWEEVSYGDVTVSGDVFGWSSMPWPTSPPGGGTRTPNIDLQGNFNYEAGEGEPFFNASTKYEFDLDGVGENANYGNFGSFFFPGIGDTDEQGAPVWAPGERFIDLNGNRKYDAGVFEWGIDKNGNGRIDMDAGGGQRRYRALSWGELVGANFTYPDDQDQLPTFNSWNNETEWFDANRDGRWNADGTQFIGGGFVANGRTYTIFRGDWGGSEIWVDRNGDFTIGTAATPIGQNQGNRPATFYEFLAEINKPDEASVEYFDEQFNQNYDFPEPFEDYLRRWDSFAHDFVPTENSYIRNNYPGDPNKLIARINNHRYDAPDFWGNWSATSSNKAQWADGFLLDEGERAEQFKRNAKLTLEPPWLGDFWRERYGTDPPIWSPFIPYYRKFNPGTPIPQLVGQGEQPTMKFEPTGGGPFNNGNKASGARYGAGDGTVLPDINHREDGWYDGPAEYDDLASSIYHSGGDGYLGEITSPAIDEPWGHDVGSGPGSPFPDDLVEAGGPLAFNVHGDGGYDGGNVLNLEVLTWRTDGISNSDSGVDLDGDGIPDFTRHHRDVNLDGLLDLGETLGDAGQYGLPDTTNYSNYSTDPFPGGRADGGPGSEQYPWNRTRLMEDMVAALDDAVDWDDFLGGPGPYGNVISGVILLPAGTAPGKFFLPAPDLHYPILTRDRVNTGATGRAHYVPLDFFDGLGISLDDDNGEGGAFDIGAFHTPFSAHEYGHSWEGYPDLYDYDIYRRDFDGKILNNPIAAWCVMAGGGLVHPVPILKQQSAWLTPVDITNALIPSAPTNLLIRAWEFDRNRTVFIYTNPLFLGESFWFWRNSPGTQSRLAFDRFQPGHGLVIMHVDDRANAEGLPTQQRLENHFTYQIVQADGLQQLEAGKNFGDAGDIWPGTSNAKTWNRNTDPSNRWYSGQGSGLDILNIQPQGNDTLVTFKWSPRELPTLEWVQPPGGISVNGVYQLRYFTYDQYGGTKIEFYAYHNESTASAPNKNGSWLNGIFMGSTPKAPGDIDGVFPASVSALNDGTYTFFAKLVPGPGNDGNIESSHSLPRPSFNNIGTGVLTVNSVDLAVSKYEVWTATVTKAQPPGSETWEVVGSLSGKQTGKAITGQPYASDSELSGDNSLHSAIAFTIAPGNIPFRAGDQFSFVTTGLTPHSAAVLIKDGEVVQPEPPIAVATVENNVTSGLAPLQVIFKHNQSSDPKGASLTFSWDFGDGSLPVTTTNLEQPIVHVYTVPRQTPYTATLTVTNSFNLSDTAVLNIAVKEASPPTVRAFAEPLTGLRPLRVKFTGDLTTDPNVGTQGLDFVWDFGDGSAAATTANVEHVYPNAGVYRASLTVTNRPFGKSASQVLEIRVTGPAGDQPPVAGFSVDRLSGVSPLKVAFNAGASFDPEGGLLEYAWNFGDGSAIQRGVSAVEHTFTKARTYNVTLTVTDPSGQTDSATLAIVVTGDSKTSNQAPVARIVASATQGPAPFTVTFDARNSGDPEGGNLSYAWDFGDGSAQTSGAVVTHTYTDPRQYSVVLVVADSQGATGAATITVSVTSPDGQSGFDTPGVGEQPAAVAPQSIFGCGGFGTLHWALMLIGLSGLRQVYGRRRP